MTTPPASDPGPRGRASPPRSVLLRGCGAVFVGWGKVRALCVRQYQLARLGQAGRNVVLGERVRIHGAAHIRVEDDVVIAEDVTLRAQTAYPWTSPPQTFSPELVLKRGCFINGRTQIACARRVVIGANTMIAEGCFISDNNHGYADPDRSVKAQPLETPGEVVIGDDGWIGAHVCVVGNVRIGRHCVVGAHSVVTRDLPDFCVAVGAPARVIRRYDPAAQAWRPVSADGARGGADGGRD